CVRWRSSGFASSIAVGKPTRRTMSLDISTPSENVARHCLRISTWMRKTLDGLPQGVKRRLAAEVIVETRFHRAAQLRHGMDADPAVTVRHMGNLVPHFEVNAWVSLPCDAAHRLRCTPPTIEPRIRNGKWRLFAGAERLGICAHCLFSTHACVPRRSARGGSDRNERNGDKRDFVHPAFPP